MIESGDEVTLAPLPKVLVDTPHVPRGQFLGGFPLQLNLPLYLADISEQVLQLRRFGSQETQIAAGIRDKSKIQSEQMQ